MTQQWCRYLRAPRAPPGRGASHHHADEHAHGVARVAQTARAWPRLPFVRSRSEGSSRDRADSEVWVSDSGWSGNYPTAVLSIVVPVFNESSLVAETARYLATEMRRRDGEFELHVVENGSTDDTLAIVTGLQESIPELRVHHLSEPDYGAALRAGLLAATGDVVVNFDVDYYDLDFLTAAVNDIRSTRADAPDFVVGSKRAPGARDTRPWYRRLVTWTFSTLLRVVFHLGVSDTHGVKAMRREAVVPLASQCLFGKDLFDSELVLRSERAGLRVTEIPVAVIERRPSRTSIVRRVPRTLFGLVRLRVALWRHPNTP